MKPEKRALYGLISIGLAVAITIASSLATGYQNVFVALVATSGILAIAGGMLFITGAGKAIRSVIASSRIAAQLKTKMFGLGSIISGIALLAFPLTVAFQDLEGFLEGSAVITGALIIPGETLALLAFVAGGWILFVGGLIVVFTNEIKLFE